MNFFLDKILWFELICIEHKRAVLHHLIFVFDGLDVSLTVFIQERLDLILLSFIYRMIFDLNDLVGNDCQLLDATANLKHCLGECFIYGILLALLDIVDNINCEFFIFNRHYNFISGVIFRWEFLSLNFWLFPL